MGKKIITHEESDEDLILGALLKGRRPEQKEGLSENEPRTELIEKYQYEEPAPPKKETKKGGGKTSDFMSTFLKENRTSARLGKNVNIRSEFHHKIRKVLSLMADNDLSYFGYIDNVLENHFTMYEDEINELLKKNNRL